MFWVDYQRYLLLLFHLSTVTYHAFGPNRLDEGITVGAI